MLNRTIAAVLCALVLLSACAEGATRQQAAAETPAQAAGDGPALWVVKDDDTTIYLFGTVHMLPDGFDWLRAPVEKAFAASDTVVFETLGTMEPGKVQPIIMAMGFSPGQPSLAARVPEAARPKLAEAVDDAGIPPAALDRMETWLATMTLSSARVVKLGYGLESGVESQLMARAISARKRIEGLETIEEQLSFFDTLPETEQRTLLANSLDDMDTIKALVDSAVKEWSAGNVDAVAALLESDVKSSPLLAQRLLADRNANWANWIAARLDSTPGTVFVAVGTGHLAGDDSVQAMLAAKGFETERIN